MGNAHSVAPRKWVPIALYFADWSKLVASTEITFDKLVYIDRLKSGGIAEPQARVHAEALDQALRDSVATRQDLVTVRQELAAAKQELRDEIKDLRVEIIRLENKFDSKIENTVALAVRDLKIWMGGAIIVAFGALATIKFFG